MKFAFIDEKEVAFPVGAIVNCSAFNDDIEWRVSQGDLSAADDHGKK